MKFSPKNRILAMLILALFSFSCTSDLDFNQVNDLKLEPVFVVNLAYFDFPASHFVMPGGSSVDAINIDYLKSGFLNKKLRKAEFFFELSNTTNSGVNLELGYFDENSQLLFSKNYSVPAYTSGVTYNEIYENIDLDLLKRTARIIYKLTLLPGSPPLDASSTGNLKLRSSATFYLLIE